MQLVRFSFQQRRSLVRGLWSNSNNLRIYLLPKIPPRPWSESDSWITGNGEDPPQSFQPPDLPVRTTLFIVIQSSAARCQVYPLRPIIASQSKALASLYSLR